jgi:hypothetical protein
VGYLVNYGRWSWNRSEKKRKRVNGRREGREGKGKVVQGFHQKKEPKILT